MKSSTRVAVATLLALAGGLALAHHGRLQEHLLNAEITSFGRYTDTGGGFVRTAGHAMVRGHDTLLETTQEIPLRIGERFGFCFEVSGFLEDGEADLQKLVTHPTMKTGERTVNGFVQEVELEVVAGKAAGCIGHALDSAQELMAGSWTIALGAGETTLAERSFELR
jgi:hypothetical protein